MSKIAKRIILAMALCIPTLHAQDPIVVNHVNSVDDNYVIYVKDIPGTIGTPIYGQVTPDHAGTYGGEKEHLFRKKYTEANKDAIAQGLDFKRDAEGIYFILPKSKALDNIDISLVKANNTAAAGSAADWNPVANDYVVVKWQLKAGPVTAATDDDNTTEVIVKTEEEEVEKAEAPAPASGWEVSYVDWILIVLFVALAGAFAYDKMRRPVAPTVTPEEVDNKLKAQATMLQSQIDEVRTTAVSNRSAIEEVGKRCNALERDARAAQQAAAKANTTPAHNDKKANDAPKQAKPQILGSAMPVNGQKMLQFDGNGFFEITQTGTRITFSLVNNPEVVNLFETNTTMLDIYKNDGIISYETITQNAHVKEVSPGVVTQDGDKFMVISPLVLSFS